MLLHVTLVNITVYTWYVCVNKLKIHSLLYFIDVNKPDRINLKTIVVICNNLEHNRKQFDEVTADLCGTNDDNEYNMYFCFTLLQNDLYQNNMLICTKDLRFALICLAEREHLQWHSIPIQNPNKFRSLTSESRSDFFHLMDPANLHVKSVVKLDYTTWHI